MGLVVYFFFLLIEIVLQLCDNKVHSKKINWLKKYLWNSINCYKLINKKLKEISNPPKIKIIKLKLNNQVILLIKDKKINKKNKRKIKNSAFKIKFKNLLVFHKIIINIKINKILKKFNQNNIFSIIKIKIIFLI